MINRKEQKVKPFIKWVGGKSQLLDELRGKYPLQLEKYCEPFVGGGAVLFDILEKYDPNEVLINDINSELINTYIQIKNNVKELIKLLKRYEKVYTNLNEKDRLEIYLKKRNEYNDLILNSTSDKLLRKAALFIFLNKTCFNGLYRVNSEGFFNVPKGAYKNPIICDENNLLLVNNYLKRVKIYCGDFEKCEDFIDNRTFVYLDPPYRPLTETSSFTSYSKLNFDDEEQIRLGKFIDRMNNKRAKIVLSNSDPKNININDNFFDDLYNKYKISRIEAKRMINSNANKRGSIKELLIANY